MLYYGFLAIWIKQLQCQFLILIFVIYNINGLRDYLNHKSKFQREKSYQINCKISMFEVWEWNNV